MQEKLLSSQLENSISTQLDSKLAKVILPWVFRHPRYLRASFALLRSVKQAKKKRLELMTDGLQVPPFLILSITSKCNLKCKGCFAAAVGNIYNSNSKINYKSKPHLDYSHWHAIIKEAKELGVMGFVIAGGEPFLFPDLLKLCKEFKDRLFIILTNGTNVSQDDFKILKTTSNVAVLVSLEGGSQLTDIRRGAGVYIKALDTLKKLSKYGIPNGISATITRMNYRYWMDEKNIDRLIDLGIRIGVFLEYIPTTPDFLNCQKSLFPQIQPNDVNEWLSDNDHMLMLTSTERLEFRKQIHNYRNKKSIYIIHSPGDEEYFGGCVSAGRGFAHVTPNGDLTPCPVSDITTHNLAKSSLRDGLASRLFCEIRDNEHLLEVEGTPCALFAHPQEVDALAKKVGAYRANSRL